MSNVTLAQARQAYFNNLLDGTTCPCCDRYGQKYKRSITSVMAVGLIALSRLDKGDGKWIDVKDVGALMRSSPRMKTTNPTSDFAKLSYWGLIIERAATANDDQRSSGLWRITDKGRAFVKSATRVPKYAFVYNKQCLGLSGSDVSIRDALGTKFSYSALLQGSP